MARAKKKKPDDVKPEPSEKPKPRVPLVSRVSRVRGSGRSGRGR